MEFITFLKEILLDEKKGLFRARADQCSLSVVLQEQIEKKNAVTNVRRLIPFSILIFFIELLSQASLFFTQAYPSPHTAHLAAGIAMLFLTAGTVFLSYRILTAPASGARLFQLLYRTFWGLFTLLMLVFVYLELSSRGLFNNFFYLLILTAAFPLLSLKEALLLFILDAAVVIPAAVYHGFSSQQLLQLPLITIFALSLSQILYNSHRANDIMLEQLAVSNKKLAALAQTDPLTGLLNRRGAQYQLQEVFSRIKHPCSVAFLMVDIDFFKTYNDRFGHKQGDQCLIQVAETLNRCVRCRTDFAARIGGEEFLIVLIGCSISDVLMSAQRLRREVLGLRLAAATDTVHHFVTVSVGAAVTETPFDFTALYGQADKALYLAKNSGRNCVALGDQVHQDNGRNV